MRIVRRVVVASIAAAVLFGPGRGRASAQTPEAQALRQQIEQLRSEFDRLKQDYGDRLTALESKLGTLDGTPPTAAAAGSPSPTGVAATPPAGGAGEGATGSDAGGAGTPALPVYGNAAAASKAFNPDMAVIGNFLGVAGSNPVSPSKALEMRESEVSFQAVVDPYARADFFVSFGESGVNLEEGFLTFTSLPGGLLTKVGKMRAAFGKVNTMHSHVLPWADRPMVVDHLLGGEDGISDAGVSVARLIPNPWLFLEATGQIFRGDSGEERSPLFSATRPSEVSYVTHLRAYQDITESSNVDLGVSYARGHNGAVKVQGLPDTFTTGLFGLDATFRWRPLQRAIYRSFVGRMEWMFSRRDQPTGLQTASGLYVSGDYQFGRRWFTGARFDSSQQPDGLLRDTGGSVWLTYWPSEFSQVRGQYRRTGYGTGQTANEFLFQFMFAIGAHGAHPF